MSSLFKHGPNGSTNHIQGPEYIKSLSTINYTVIDQWSGFRPSAFTRPRKSPARSIHSSTEEQHCGFSQMVTHPSTNAANCCLTSILVTLAFYHSAIGKRKNSSGDLSTLSRISQCILMQHFAK